MSATPTRPNKPRGCNAVRWSSVDRRWLHGSQPCPVHDVPGVDGVDRCACGCKYWDGYRCIDCGAHVNEARINEAQQ